VTRDVGFFVGLGRILQAGYVSGHVLNIPEIKQKSDTRRIRIEAVSAAYPYRIRIRYVIWHLLDVSVLRRMPCFCSVMVPSTS